MGKRNYEHLSGILDRNITSSDNIVISIIQFILFKTI